MTSALPLRTRASTLGCLSRRGHDGNQLIRFLQEWTQSLCRYHSALYCHLKPKGCLVTFLNDHAKFGDELLPGPSTTHGAIVCTNGCPGSHYLVRYHTSSNSPWEIL